MDILNSLTTPIAQDNAAIVIALDLANRIIAHSSDSILVSLAEPINRPGPCIIFANETFKNETGYTDEELLGENPRVMQGPKTDKATLARIRSGLAAWQPIREEVLNYKKNGEEFWQELNIFPVPNASGHFTHWVSIQRNITERKIAEKRIFDMAFLDPLTGLPNRRYFFDRLQKTLQGGKHNNQHTALLYIDIDQFKLINDRHGHSVGDKVLQNVARCLALCIRAEDTIARIGGDEYVVALARLGEDFLKATSLTEQIAARMLGSLVSAKKQNWEDLEASGDWTGTVSIGVTIFSGDQSRTLEQVMKEADLAMYQAKEIGGNCVQFYDREMRQANIDKTLRIDMLREALTNNWFALYFQPQADRHGIISGFEALLRLKHPSLGVILPGTFIPLAEATDLITPIGDWVLSQACEQLARWAIKPAFAAYRLSVNVSLKQFQNIEFISELFAVIKRTGANPKLLGLEITESVSLTQTANFSEQIQLITAKGIHLSLDDFGTGFSSLTYLKNLPFNELKIDQSFIADITTDAASATIVKATIEIGKSLGLTVIAEGVENHDQLDALIQAGCNRFQGHLFAKPMPIEALEAELGTRVKLT